MSSPSRTRQDGEHSDPVEFARTTALNVLDRTAVSSHQLREKMLKRGVELDAADHIISRFEELGLLNDQDLACAIVRTRQRSGKAGRAVLPELKRKGFSPEVITRALQEISPEDEEESAKELAYKLWLRYSSVAADVRQRRIYGALARRGYSGSLAQRIVTDLNRSDSSGVFE